MEARRGRGRSGKNADRGRRRGRSAGSLEDGQSGGRAWLSGGARRNAARRRADGPGRDPDAVLSLRGRSGEHPHPDREPARSDGSRPGSGHDAGALDASQHRRRRGSFGRRRRNQAAGRGRRAMGYGALAVERAPKWRFRRRHRVRQCRALRRHRPVGGASYSRRGGGRGLAVAHRASS